MTGVKYYAMFDHGVLFPLVDHKLERFVIRRGSLGVYWMVYRSRVQPCVSLNDSAIQAAIDSGEMRQVSEEQVDLFLKRV